MHTSSPTPGLPLLITLSLSPPPCAPPPPTTSIRPAQLALLPSIPLTPTAFDKQSSISAIHVVGMLLEFCQLISLILQIRIEWGEPMASVCSALESVFMLEVDFLPFSCFSNNPLVVYIAETLWPLGLLIPLLLILAVDRCCPLHDPCFKALNRHNHSSLLTHLPSSASSSPLLSPSFSPLASFHLSESLPRLIISLPAPLLPHLP